MANLPKPVICGCGNTAFIHLFKPERWVCKTCEAVCAERPQRNDPNICRKCKAHRGSKPFSKWANVCLECKRKYNKEYNIENKDKISQQHRDSYQRNRKKRIAAVRAAYQRSPEAFLRAQMHHLTKLVNQAKKGKGQSHRLVKAGGLIITVEIDLPFLLSLWTSQQGRCALSGLPMTHRFNDLCASSIDRKDSSLGYIPGNVQLVCQWVNRAKNKHSDEEMRGVLEALRSSPC